MPIALSTWKHGLIPNEISYEALKQGKLALDAVELGSKYCEADLTCMSVGRGAIPDELGKVTLDASVMDHDGSCGGVAFVQHYLNVASIARRVMEHTPHVLLAGEGAERFAEQQGFQREELITEKAQALYERWREHPDKVKVRLRRSTEGDHEYVFESTEDDGTIEAINREQLPSNSSHDTIGLIAMDRNGRLAGACTTSGLAFKMHGRVGDSPIIGAGLFVDGSVAAAVATGNGELMMRSCATFHIVEQIRQGVDPAIACENTLARIERDKHLTVDAQVGLLVIRADGVWSARSLRPGFQFAAADGVLDGNVLFDCTPTGYDRAPN